jgi:hypothetical protein
MKRHVCICLRRPLERFAAVVDVGATAELNPSHALVLGSQAPEAEAMRDSPSRAILARIVAAVYVAPPAEGRPSDGLAVPVEGGPGMIPERVFVVVRRFRDQAGADEKVMRDLGLMYHATRWPRKRAPASPLYELLPLDAVLRAVRVFPARWPGMTITQMLLFGARTEGAARSKHLRKLALCRDEEEPILVFWPPTRHTFLPGPQVPQQPFGAEEEEEMGGVARELVF